MLAKIETKIVTDPNIYFPQSNVLYKVVCPNIPEEYVEIFFRGTIRPRVGLMNVYYHNYYVGSSGGRRKYEWDESFSFESVESLPPHFKSEKLPPILSRENNNLYYVKKITFETHNNTQVITTITEALPYKLILWNKDIQQECQAILKDIPIRIRGAIFKPANLPSTEFLHNLYHQFWVFNKKKLTDQNKMSEDYCHIRAHFVNIFLSLYYIDSIKIFKLWDRKQWNKECHGDKCWEFHCAILIVDNNNNKWVWDPWDHLSPTLVPLKDWVNDKKYPEPIEIVFGNRSIIDCEHDLEIQWLNFNDSATKNYRSIFQGLFGSAIPNPPSLPIKIKNDPIRFFQPEKILGNVESTQKAESRKYNALGM